jgi:hypothetical protein
MAGRLGKDEISLPMKAFLLLVTWFASNQPPSHYQVQFSSNQTCEAARQQLIKDAERIGQAVIERATAQDRQLGSSDFVVSELATVTARCAASAACCAIQRGGQARSVGQFCGASSTPRRNEPELR